MRRFALVLPLAALMATLAATPARAFAGRDGAVVYGWFSYLVSTLEPNETIYSETAIRTISPRGGTPSTVRGCTRAAGKADVGDCSIGYTGPAVSPNGVVVAFGTGAQIALMRIDGSRFRLLPAHGGADAAPAFSPTGKRLAFAATPSGIVSEPRPPSSVWTSDLAGARARLIVSDATAPAWSSRNWIAFVRGDGIYRVRPDGHGLRRLVKRTLCTDVAWSPHGTKLALACRDRLLIADGDGRHLRRVKGTGAVAVVWSPSGKRLAVTPFDGGVVTMRLDGTHQRGLVAGAYSSMGALGAAGVDWQPLR